MLCKTISSGNEHKEEDKLGSNGLVNLNYFEANIETF